MVLTLGLYILLTMGQGGFQTTSVGNQVVLIMKQVCCGQGPEEGSYNSPFRALGLPNRLGAGASGALCARPLYSGLQHNRSPWYPRMPQWTWECC